MKEIEVKFQVKDFLKIKKELWRRGAKRLWQGIEENYFFDTKERRLSKQKEVLRIKKMKKAGKDVFLLTVKTGAKRRDKRFKVRDEYEITISDFHTAKKILAELGFQQWFYYRKYREHWKLGKLSIELDHVHGKRFIEAEGPKRAIERFAKQPGLSWEKSTTKGYSSLLKHARGKN